DRGCAVFAISALAASVGILWKTPIYQLPIYAFIAVYFGVWVSRIAGASDRFRSRATCVLALAITWAVSQAIGSASARKGWKLLDDARADTGRSKVRQALWPAVPGRVDRTAQLDVRPQARWVIDLVPPGSTVMTVWSRVYPLEYVSRLERGVET